MIKMTISKRTLRDKRLNSTDKLILALGAEGKKMSYSAIGKTLGYSRQAIRQDSLKMRKLGVLK